MHADFGTPQLFSGNACKYRDLLHGRFLGCFYLNKQTNIYYYIIIRDIIFTHNTVDSFISVGSNFPGLKKTFILMDI